MQAIERMSRSLWLGLSLILFSTCPALAGTTSYWLLATNAVGTTTMTDGAVTLNVKVTSAASRTLTLGTETSTYANAIVGGQTATGCIDLSKPILLAGGTDTWSITKVGQYAFCNNKAVTFPDAGLDLRGVEVIGARAFTFCSGIKKVRVSESLTTIDSYAFASCSNLTAFEPMFPDSLTTINGLAFAPTYTGTGANAAPKLAGSVSLKGLTSLGRGSFRGNTAITEVLLGAGLSTIATQDYRYEDNRLDMGGGVFDTCTSLRRIVWFGAYPQSSANNYFFYGCETNSVTNVVMSAHQASWEAAPGYVAADFAGTSVFGTHCNAYSTPQLLSLASGTEPFFSGTPTVTCSEGSYVFSTKLYAGTADVYVRLGTEEGVYGQQQLMLSGATAGTTVSGAITGLVAGTTYYFEAFATNASGETAESAGATAFYAGDILIGVGANADKAGLASGYFTVSRTGTVGDLSVNYVIPSHSAVFGTDCEPLLPGSVTIPDGSTSARIYVIPLSGITEDKTVTVALAAGGYGIGEASEATLTIQDWHAVASGAFPKCATLAVADYAGETVLTNFPVLVRLGSGAIAKFSYDDLHVDGYLGFAFYGKDANGDEVLLDHEIDTWDESGTSLVWVCVPLLDAGTQIKFCYGRPGYHQNNVHGSVWTDNGYVGVWHFACTDAGGTSPDSTINGLDGINSSTTTGRVDGAVGYCRFITDSARGTQSGAHVRVPYDSVMNVGSNFTFSVWARKNNWDGTNGWGQGYYDKMFMRADSTRGFGVTFDGTGTSLKYYGNWSGQWLSSSQLISNQYFSDFKWHNFTSVYDGTNCAVYADGQFIANTVVASVSASYVADLYFGNISDLGTQYGGCLDESRFRVGSSGADWIKAAYDTIKSESFLSYGAVTFTGPTVLIVR